MNKMMSVWSLGVGLAMAALPCAGLSDDEEDMVFLHYQNLVQPNDTGIYEDDGLLYVQVKVPFDRRKETVAKKKSEVVLTAYELLKKWAVDYSAPKRDQADDSPDGVKFAKNIAVEYLPEWQFREWSPKYSAREFPHKTDEGHYVLGQSVEKAVVIKNIPDSFYRPFAYDDWPDALVSAVKRGIAKEGREKVVARCQAWDALADCEKVGDAEFKKVDELIGKYLESSELAKSMRDAKTRITGPFEDVSWSEVPCAGEVTTNVVLVSVTNELKNAVVKDGEKIRQQTNHEVEKIGRSFGTSVKAETETKDEAEVVETMTCTVIETRKLIRRKVVSRIKGSPRFEEIFLAGGQTKDKSRLSTALGGAAEKTYFASSTVDVKETKLIDALRENPGDARLWNLYGKCLASKGDHAGAAICFKTSLRLDHDYEFALVNLSEAYQSLGFRTLAVGLATYARAVAKDKWCVTHAEAVLQQ